MKGQQLRLLPGVVLFMNQAVQVQKQVIGAQGDLGFPAEPVALNLLQQTDPEECRDKRYRQRQKFLDFVVAYTL